MHSITIIGTGLAGYNLAKEIRKLDKELPLNIITADGGESYSKPMLSNALSKGKTTQQLVMGNADKMESQLNAKIHTRTVVKTIDAKKRILETDSGTFDYDKLVLAVGASQNKLPIAGNAADRLLSINNLDQYEKFQQQLETANKVLIIGAGLIGCEFANDLVAIDKHVTVIGSSDIPLDRLLLPEIGEQLKVALQKEGVNWRLGVKVTAIDTSNESEYYQVSLSDGSTVDADLVISATGLLPNVALAEQAKLAINKGILVDQYLETSVDGIYALGDCIEINGMVLAYVLPIMNCARALAKTLTGDKTKVSYPAMPVVVKTPCYPMVISLPPRNAEGQWQLENDASGIKALFTGSDDQLKGFILTDQKLSEKQSLTRQLPAILN